MRFSPAVSALTLGLLFFNVIAVPVQQDENLRVVDASLPGAIKASHLNTILNRGSGPISETTGLPNQGEDAIINIIPRARVRKGRTQRKKRPSKAKKRPNKPKNKTPKSKKSKSKSKAKSKKGKASKESWKQPVPTEAEITRKCKVPKDRAIFWSGVWPETEAYSKQKNLVHDELAYPKGYTMKYMRPNGKAYDEKKNQLFAIRFSKVFARKARGVVYVMVPWEKGPTPGRVFARDEWPILKKSLAAGRISKIIQVNPKDFKETREYDPKVYGLTKRSGGEVRGVELDIDLENVPWDVNLDALTEAFNL